MKKIKTLVLLYTVFVLCKSVGLGGASQPISLLAEVEVSPQPPMPDDDINDPWDDALLLEYRVEIRNIGKTTVKLPTRGFERHWSGTENSIQSEIQWNLEKTGRRTIIVPECDYGFVLLRPNESAFIRWKEILFKEERLAKIEIIYRVAKDFGKRYESWYGIKHVICAGTPKPPLKTWRAKKEGALEKEPKREGQKKGQVDVR
ncbi:hypothetical protein [Ereboglobus luteus]|uniref:hypothetical protein n=1 Tax=Ereboglobus luteus TaxID=1796921 RepID=UPI0012600C89|nr:hypothetical protein [Ereboglobus luteus]